MAVVTLPQHSQLPGDKMSPPHRSMENSKRHAPRPKSILKSNRRPSQQELRPLNRALTDSFPIELIKIVLDALQYDRDAMRSCTLVCRSWLRMCREYYKPDITVHPGNASRFLDLISSPYVSITDSIRHLTIHKQFNVVDHCFLVNSPQTSPTLSRPFLLPKPLQLPDILSRATAFPYLNKLTLQKGYGESSAIASSLREFHYLQELELRSFEFVSFSDLAAVISAQPNIQRLSLTDIAWGIRNASPSTTGTSTSVLPNLRHLELFMEKQAVLFNWILARPSIPNIEYVELGGITELDDAIAVSRFLRGLGPVLKHLRLYSPNRISQVNLVHNTNLESLTISHLHIGLNERRDKSDRTGSGHDEVCAIISQLCSPHIRKISLQLLFNEPECFAFIDWNQLSRVLSLPRYQKLKLLELRIPRLKRWMATTIVRSLPNLANNGILAVANG